MPSEFRIKPTLANAGPWTVLKFPVWSQFSLGQTTGLSAGAGSGFQDPELRNSFYSLFSVNCVHEAQQVHGNRLQAVQAHSAGYRGCDGLLGVSTNTMLTMRTADCLPVFVKNESGTRFALLHAGWRGLADGIIEKALEKWFIKPVEIIIGLGITQDAYEVGSEVITDLKKNLGCSESDLRADGILDNDNHLDLFGWCREQAYQTSHSVIHIGRVDPNQLKADVPVHSFRRSTTDNRMLNWISKNQN